MHSSHSGLELLANDHVARRLAEADHHRLVRQAQLARGSSRRTTCRAAGLALANAVSAGTRAGPFRTGEDWITAVLGLILLLGGLILLDVLAIRFGYDSRDGFETQRIIHIQD